MPIRVLSLINKQFSNRLNMATAPQQAIEDSRFEEILGLEGLDLQEFFQQEPTLVIFPEATSFPDFFNENLISPNRILKQLLDNPHSNIRIFYFQILRLGYEIESENDFCSNVILNFRRIVFHPEFEILFTQETEDQRDLYNDFQFKKLFAQFIVFLDKQEYPNVEEILHHYPIMDTVFIHILRSLLASQNINEEFDTKIPSEVVFVELCLLFELSVTSYGNCWKFEDSDMFCYEENENELYMAYILEEGETDAEDASHVEQRIEQRQQEQDAGHQPQRDINAQSITAETLSYPNHNIYSNQNSVIQQPRYQYPESGQTSNQSPSESNRNIQKSTSSMTTENYEFTDYLGNTTTQKHRIPRQKDETALSKNYEGFLSKVENTIKSSFSYNNQAASNFSNIEPPINTYMEKLNDYKPPSAHSTSYNKPTLYDYTQKYSGPSGYSSNPTSSYNIDYKPYEPRPYSNNFGSSYSSSFNSTSDLYNKYGSTSSFSGYDSFYKSSEFIPTHNYKPEIPSFKPVEPTPLPNFDAYKPSYRPQPRRDHSIPTSAYQPSYNYTPPYPTSSYSSNAFQSSNYTSSIYKPVPSISYNTDGTGDYYRDFTPPDILSKLRVENRENISKIRESMKGVTRGGEVPPDLNLKRSAIYDHSNTVEVKPELYRNQSRSQFQYPEIYKTASSKPLTNNDLNYYSSGRPCAETNTNYQSAYSQISY